MAPDSTNDRIGGYASDVAFTPTVKDIQQRKGSRQAYARMERAGSWDTGITPELAEFIAAQTSCFLGTANAAGQPYIQHRGGPPGFIHVLDEHTLGFVDFKGNQQFITQGNLIENPLAHLFLIDYDTRRRIKIWGEARVVEGDDELLTRLGTGAYKARPEQVILFTVRAWDANCPQHIPRRIDYERAAAVFEQQEQRIKALELEVERLSAARGAP